jgi:polysaccharide export outer membrane protein
MKAAMRPIVLSLLTGCAALALSGCVAQRAITAYADARLNPQGGYDRPLDEEALFADIGYAQWNDAEPPYRLYPGDKVSVVVRDAPEYSKELTVQQDGRITLPAIGQVMAANRSIEDIRAEVMARYATELLRPDVDMTVDAAPLKVFVGGEVGTPGAYDLVGDSNALQAVVQAGGFKTTANEKKVIIIRRGPEGTAMMRTANLGQAFRHGDQPDLVPLRRMDVIYVPRSGAANAALFMQQYFRDLLPLPGSFSYAVNGFGVSSN